MRYAIRRISPLSALFYGLLIGLIGWFLPGILLALLARSIVMGLLDWLNGFRLLVPLPFGDGSGLDLTAALPVGNWQERLAALAGQDVALFLAIALGTAAAGMLLTGVTAFLGALFYNLFASGFGGVEVTLTALEPPGSRARVKGVTDNQRRPPAAAELAAPPPLVSPRPRPEPATPPRAAAAWLSAAGDGNARWVLDAEVTRIGSAQDNDIVVAGLAPQHAEIRRESGRYLIYDLGSRRTWVNDVQVPAVHMLKDGFHLQLGQAGFIVHIPATGPSPVEKR